MVFEWFWLTLKNIIPAASCLSLSVSFTGSGDKWVSCSHLSTLHHFCNTINPYSIKVVLEVRRTWDAFEIFCLGTGMLIMAHGSLFSLSCSNLPKQAIGENAIQYNRSMQWNVISERHLRLPSLCELLTQCGFFISSLDHCNANEGAKDAKGNVNGTVIRTMPKSKHNLWMIILPVFLPALAQHAQNET